MKENFPLSQNNKILKGSFPKNSILVANKREYNLKDFLLRSDSYNIKRDLLDNTKHGYKHCKRNAIFGITLWMKQQPSDLLLLEKYLKSEEFKSLCQTVNVIYAGHCLCAKSKALFQLFLGSHTQEIISYMLKTM